MKNGLERHNRNTLNKVVPARRPEGTLQRAVFQHIRACGLLGLDLLLWCSGRAFAMELKSEGGRTSEVQLEMLNRLSEAGVFTAVCHDLDRALRCVVAWG
jgi:hypothetical protein